MARPKGSKNKPKSTITKKNNDKAEAVAKVGNINIHIDTDNDDSPKKRKPRRKTKIVKEYVPTPVYPKPNFSSSQLSGHAMNYNTHFADNNPIRTTGMDPISIINSIEGPVYNNNNNQAQQQAVGDKNQLEDILRPEEPKPINNTPASPEQILIENQVKPSTLDEVGTAGAILTGAGTLLGTGIYAAETVAPGSTKRGLEYTGTKMKKGANKTGNIVMTGLNSLQNLVGRKGNILGGKKKTVGVADYSPDFMEFGSATNTSNSVLKREEFKMFRQRSEDPRVLQNHDNGYKALKSEASSPGSVFIPNRSESGSGGSGVSSNSRVTPSSKKYVTPSPSNYGGSSNNIIEKFGNSRPGSAGSAVSLLGGSPIPIPSRPASAGLNFSPIQQAPTTRVKNTVTMKPTPVRPTPSRLNFFSPIQQAPTTVGKTVKPTPGAGAFRPLNDENVTKRRKQEKVTMRKTASRPASTIPLLSATDSSKISIRSPYSPTNGKVITGKVKRSQHPGYVKGKQERIETDKAGRKAVPWTAETDMKNLVYQGYYGPRTNETIEEFMNRTPPPRTHGGRFNQNAKKKDKKDKKDKK